MSRKKSEKELDRGREETKKKKRQPPEFFSPYLHALKFHQLALEGGCPSAPREDRKRGFTGVKKRKREYDRNTQGLSF